MLHINDLVFRREGRLLLDGASLTLLKGSHMGFVGRNGSGKSTLLKLIKGEISPDDGTITLHKKARLGTADQEAPGGPKLLLDYVLEADTERMALLKKLETEQDPHSLADIHTRLSDIGAHSAEARAGMLLNGLGFKGEDQQRPLQDYSSGWRMRAALAAALFARPDVLLLDEPGNYLDLEGVLWLGNFLRHYEGAFLLVSHDRDLLNRCVKRIAHLEGGKIQIYSGGYDDFQRLLAEQQSHNMKFQARQEEERRHLQAFVDRFRAKASKARQAQSRIKRLEKLQVSATRFTAPVAGFHFPVPQKVLAPPLLRLENVTTGYHQDQPVLSDMVFRLDGGDRLGLLGRNGAGKSTFVKLLNGELQPFSGRFLKHKKLDIAVFSQKKLDDLNPALSAYDHIKMLMEDATEAQRRAKLAQFGLGAAQAETPAGELSGGERTRLALHLTCFHGAHILILDEPANHLDMDSRSALVEALNAYEGALLLISHDKFLIEACVNDLWHIEHGTLSRFEGDMATYENTILAASRKKPSKKSGNKSSHGELRGAEKRRALAEARASLAPLKRMVKHVEERMETLTKHIKNLDKGLADETLYDQPEKLTVLAKERREVEKELQKLEQEWLKLSERLEQQAD